MVTLTESKFVIEVECNGGNPHEDYVNTVNDIIEVLSMREIDQVVACGSNSPHLLDLLKAMMPTGQQAKLMFEELQPRAKS